jgi:hypothetical protein
MQEIDSGPYVAALLGSMGLLVLVGIYVVVRTSRQSTARIQRLIAEGKIEPTKRKPPKVGKLPRVNLPGGADSTAEDLGQGNSGDSGSAKGDSD